MRFRVLQLAAFFCRGILSLRYRVQAKGLDQLASINPKKGVLFLSNHPALIDGFLLCVFLWSKYFTRPVVAEYVANLVILRPLVKVSKTIGIPNLERVVNEEQIRKVHDCLRTISEGLKKGESFLLYPAGRLRRSGKEVLGGASGVYRILQEYPEVQIVLLRVRGLWGSSFSRAIVGLSVHVPFPPLIFRGIWILLKNGIFFCPRRPVTIDISTETQNLPRRGTRSAINHYLEKWYNSYPDGKDSEPVQLISHSFWYNDVDKVDPLLPVYKEDRVHIAISEEVQREVYEEIRKFLDDSTREIHPELTLSVDLGLDSLDLASLTTQLAKGCKIDDLHSERLVKVRDVLEFAESRRNKN